MSRITAPVGEVITPTTRGRNGSEQPFRGELLLALLQESHQRAGAGRLDRLDDDLIAGLAGIGRHAARRDHFQALFGLEAEAGERAFPDHRIDLGALILDGEIGVSRGVLAAKPGDLPAQAHEAERVLHRTLDGVGEFGNGDFKDIAAWCVVHSRQIMTKPEAVQP
jgi:hypothetical protein